MATEKIAIVVTGIRFQLNDTKPIVTTPEGKVNLDARGVPYVNMKFRDDSNPLAPREFSYMHRAQTLKANGEQIEYSVDDTPEAHASNIKIAKANGFIMPTTLVSALSKNLQKDRPSVVMYVEDNCEYVIGENTVNSFKAIYPIGTPVSTFKAEMKRRNITILAEPAADSVKLDVKEEIGSDDKKPF